MPFQSSIPTGSGYKSGAREGEIDLEKVSDEVLQRAASAIGDVAPEVETVSRQEDPDEVLANVAQEQGAQLIVVGDRGLTAVKRFLLGSVSNKLAHHAPTDILIVRGSADG